MVTSFDIETPFMNEGDLWVTLTISADITEYGHDELVVCDEHGLELEYKILPSEVRTQIDLHLCNLVMDAQRWAFRRLSRVELSYEHT